MAATADRFAALADGTRRHLLEQLATADRPVSELMTGLDISQAAVSQHLRILREAGLVTARKQGRHRYYQLRPAALEELRDWLDELEQFWRARLTPRILGQRLPAYLGQTTAGRDATPPAARCEEGGGHSLLAAFRRPDR
jgi:DNA-binding transcriptional ArsR family regulator